MIMLIAYPSGENSKLNIPAGLMMSLFELSYSHLAMGYIDVYISQCNRL